MRAVAQTTSYNSTLGSQQELEDSPGHRITAWTIGHPNIN